MGQASGDLRQKGGTTRIESFRFGEIVVAGQRYTEDLILLEHEVRPQWRRKDGHLLTLDDLQEALAAEPEALIVGTGTQQLLKIATEVLAHLNKAGIELLAFDTRTACQTFNHLLGKRRIVAVLHLTC